MSRKAAHSNALPVEILREQANYDETPIICHQHKVNKLLLLFFNYLICAVFSVTFRGASPKQTQSLLSCVR